MSYRINALASEQETEVMVAGDSFDPIVERLQRMVTAGRGMVIALREFTYLGRPPILHSGLNLDTAHQGGFTAGRGDNYVACTVRLTNGGSGYHDTSWFGFNERTYQYSGNETEVEAWKRYMDHKIEAESHFARRRDMTHIGFTGGLPGWKWQHTDRIVITDWNSDGVATERVLGFEPGEGSW